MEEKTITRSRNTAIMRQFGTPELVGTNRVGEEVLQRGQ